MSRLLILFFLVLLSTSGFAERFYPDDPLEAEPEPFPVQDPEPRQLSGLLELVNSGLGRPGERQPEGSVIPAGGINTLGEVMDGPWYINRHATKPITKEELLRGPGDQSPPSPEGKWEVLVVKSYGLRPGILIRDSNERLYLLRFDPAGFLETTTSAQMIASRFFYALGYHVPQCYLVNFGRDRLKAWEDGQDVTSMGDVRKLTEENIDSFLKKVAVDPNQGYRAIAVLLPGEATKTLGPYQVYGLRSDDPNDIVPHEHRRDLRGLSVFSAWLNYDQIQAMSTLDILKEKNDIAYIEHYLIDFQGALGSGTGGSKSPWRGNDQILGSKSTFTNILGMGIYSPAWMRAKYPSIQGVGRFECEIFDPERWTTNYELAPFVNRLPDDTFWAARQVMAFTDDDIRTLVSTGQYTDPKATEWITNCLIERRNKIGKAYLSKVLPLDRFAIINNALTFRDLQTTYRFIPSRNYNVQWFNFDNKLNQLTKLTNKQTEFSLPNSIQGSAAGNYFAGKINAEDPEKDVIVYIRKEATSCRIVGLDYNWAGKVLANPQTDTQRGKGRYNDLTEEQKKLFQHYTDAYNLKAEQHLTSPEYFDSLTISERTTYDGVTDALMKSELLDENGNSLGRAIDLVQGIERIAGQYYGRSGDQQFRIYAVLDPNTKEILDESNEFSLERPNKVYHPGYPISYRQSGKEPTLQFSVSDDGLKADIDVDYRSSKTPKALFNGHLTSANSDVRAGDNYSRHTRRWEGLIEWWKEPYGSVDEPDEKGSPSPPHTSCVQASPSGIPEPHPGLDQ